MKIGLGTFNPIHVGHLIIANHMAENSDLDQVWLVVTPHKPPTPAHCATIACKMYLHISSKSKPNYTVNTFSPRREIPQS
jgi:nicotinic acid mononucleotide adenylyltransferase